MTVLNSQVVGLTLSCNGRRKLIEEAVVFVLLDTTMFHASSYGIIGIYSVMDSLVWEFGGNGNVEKADCSQWPPMAQG